MKNHIDQIPNKTIKKNFYKSFFKKGQSGQSLIEYLIVVALMGVASLGVMRLLNHTVNAQFSDVINALQGKNKRVRKQSVQKSLYKQKDLSNFMNGAAQRKNKSKNNRPD